MKQIKSSEQPDTKSQDENRIGRTSPRGNRNTIFLARIKRSDRWMIVLTAVIGIAGVISAVIFGSQLQVMKMQLAEMRSSSRQVNQSIDAAKRLASAAEDQIAISRDTEHNDLRAYIVLDPQEPQFIFPHPKDESSMVVDIGVRNSGRTPATVIHAWTKIELVEAGHARGQNLSV